MKPLLLLSATLLLAPAAQLLAAEPARPPYNVLFIAIDDLNDWVGAFGGAPQEKSATPKMDKFAQGGAVVFQQANCAASVCCPSRSALLSGFRPNRSGIYGNGQNMQWTNLAASPDPEIRTQKARLAALFPSSFAPSIPNDKTGKRGK